jgi:hypothetical protein
VGGWVRMMGNQRIEERAQVGEEEGKNLEREE